MKLQPMKYFYNIFLTVQKNVMVYGKCRETVNLFSFLLSPCNMEGHLNVCTILEVAVSQSLRTPGVQYEYKDNINYKIIMMQFIGSFPRIICPSKNCSYFIVVRYNLTDSRFQNICNFEHMRKRSRTRFVSVVYNQDI
jgi:hypothetical protein